MWFSIVLGVSCQDIGSDRFRLEKKENGKAILSRRGDGNSLEFHIFPRGALAAEDVTTRVHRDDLKVVLLFGNLPRSEFAQLRGEGDKASATISGSEDAGLEGLAGFLIDECSDLHPTACCKLQQVARRNDVTHTNF